ncbi:MAG: 50S ribosomal protein L25 [Candidatus Vogelbacteria bacterium CG22_combo_CG10-13_8_21_14_all_37_9]|uniref:Large ribosomal subunit protein bL25 n=1 Tax=Candidatus Vogelbacteria bacterium CG22_combo_CG10-13_8_21_14_all_37_9 TaxID=1975046 RepID=A0A2H0BL21_9BACT|nr:MAG: hypothetical protein BK005_00175 [bacterium CG10_37_50]PIP58376.1 MAG: 50S ribosomal protein L25 [Candidatus Vogelbacteria bacterium CG22_combo_CG10-13_8_21_14_all_37_9]
MLTLTAERREIFSKDLDAERSKGRLPAVIYGAENSAESLFLDFKEFNKVLASAGESTLVTVLLGADKKDVLIHEVAKHPISGQAVHVDLFMVDVKKPIQVEVPLVFEGVAGAVKDFGGALIKVLHELEVEALPKDLPHDLIVDISLLTQLDSQIYVSDVKLPVGVTMITAMDEVVASVTEAGEVVEEEVPIDISEIEVEKKGKTEEEPESTETKE